MRSTAAIGGSVLASPKLGLTVPLGTVVNGVQFSEGNLDTGLYGQVTVRGVLLDCVMDRKAQRSLPEKFDSGTVCMCEVVGTKDVWAKNLSKSFPHLVLKPISFSKDTKKKRRELIAA